MNAPEWFAAPVPLWALLVLSLVAGGGGVTLKQLVAPPRPDPWTGSQAEKAHDKIGDRVDRVSADVDYVRRRLVVLDLMPEQLSAVETRLSRMQVDIAVLLKRTEYLEKEVQRGGG